MGGFLNYIISWLGWVGLAVYTITSDYILIYKAVNIILAIVVKVIVSVRAV